MLCSAAGSRRETMHERFISTFLPSLDKQYFMEAMRRSRENKKRRLAKLKEIMAASRSGAFALAHLPEVDDLPGLAEDLNRFVGSIPQVDLGDFCGPGEFVMETYRKAILEYLDGLEVMFSALPDLCDDVRVERARRFVTLVYMEHEGEVVLTQYENDILVEKNEADLER